MQGLLPSRPSYPQSSKLAIFKYESLLVLPPGVSLGVLCLRETHSATYNEHMPK